MILITVIHIQYIHVNKINFDIRAYLIVCKFFIVIESNILLINE